MSFYQYFREVCGLGIETDKLQGIVAVAKSAGWWLPHKNVCWISERHNILRRDERGRLHDMSGPAVAYPDGWAIYAVHGVRVPSWIIERKDLISPTKIESEDNTEIRRIMIEIVGSPRYIRDSGLEPIESRENAVEGTLEALYR